MSIKDKEGFIYKLIILGITLNSVSPIYELDMLCYKVWSFEGGENSDDGILGCEVVLYCR
jgi:hypothetical protein